MKLYHFFGKKCDLQVENAFWTHVEEEVEDAKVGLEAKFVGKDLVVGVEGGR